MTPPSAYTGGKSVPPGNEHLMCGNYCLDRVMDSPCEPQERRTLSPRLDPPTRVASDDSTSFSIFLQPDRVLGDMR